MSTKVPPQLPRGQPPIRLAFVAEAPSHEEVDQGIPLVGPSGRIFNAMLRTAGIDRGECLVTNVFDEKLPDNNVANWCTYTPVYPPFRGYSWPRIGTAGFLRPEFYSHLDRLRAELEAWQPHVVVPMGGTALWALTGKTEISALRGALQPATALIPGKKLLPTFHPAAVMHQWKLFTVVVGDMIKAAQEAEKGPLLVYPKRELLLAPTLQEIRDYGERIRTSDLLSVDIETGWGQITCIGFAPDQEQAICIPFVDLRHPSRSYWKRAEEECEAWEIVRAWLASSTPKVGQNFGSYDAFWLLKKMNIQVRNYQHDTRLLHHALYPELPKSLGFMGAAYANQGPWKVMGKRKTEKRDD